MRIFRNLTRIKSFAPRASDIGLRFKAAAFKGADGRTRDPASR